MPVCRVGKLDNPSRMGGARSVAVYMTATGMYFTLISGRRRKLSSATRWHSLSGTSMRGGHPLLSTDPVPADNTAEADQLALAIENSLRDAQGIQEESTSGSTASTSAPKCVICIDNPADILVRPCKHVCMCASCSPQMSDRPCPVCRGRVTTMERIYLN